MPKGIVDWKRSPIYGPCKIAISLQYDKDGGEGWTTSHKSTKGLDVIHGILPFAIPMLEEAHRNSRSVQQLWEVVNWRAWSGALSKGGELKAFKNNLISTYKFVHHCWSNNRKIYQDELYHVQAQELVHWSQGVCGVYILTNLEKIPDHIYIGHSHNIAERYVEGHNNSNLFLTRAYGAHDKREAAFIEKQLLRKFSGQDNVRKIKTSESKGLFCTPGKIALDVFDKMISEDDILKDMLNNRIKPRMKKEGDLFVPEVPQLIIPPSLTEPATIPAINGRQINYDDPWS